MKIRTADDSDSEAVACLVLELLIELAGNQPNGYSQPALAETARMLLQEKAIAALLAEHAGHAIGVIVLNPCASLYAGRFAEITELYVKPEFRSTGVGRKLLEAAVGIARANSWSRLEVGTPELPVWTRTAAFYRRNGFIEVGARMKLPLQVLNVAPSSEADSR